MDAVIAGFRDTMKDELVEDPNEILQKWGPELNKVLQERAAGVVDKMKEEGDDFAKNFQECNDDAVKVRGGEGGGGKASEASLLGKGLLFRYGNIPYLCTMYHMRPALRRHAQ